MFYFLISILTLFNLFDCLFIVLNIVIFFLFFFFTWGFWRWWWFIILWGLGWRLFWSYFCFSIFRFWFWFNFFRRWRLNTFIRRRWWFNVFNISMRRLWWFNISFRRLWFFTTTAWSYLHMSFLYRISINLNRWTAWRDWWFLNLRFNPNYFFYLFIRISSNRTSRILSSWTLKILLKQCIFLK